MNRTIKDFVIEATCWSAALFFLGGYLVHLPNLPSEVETVVSRETEQAFIAIRKGFQRDKE